MATFGERLKQVRNEKHITLDQLADKLGTTKATLSRYENNLREPKAEFAEKCANFFNVSADYLLGRTDSRGIQESSSILKLTVKEQQNLDEEATKVLNELAMSMSRNKEYLEDKDYEVLLVSVRNLLETMTLKNKEKYTPKIYKDKK